MFPTVENRKDRFYFCSTKNLSFPDHLHAHIEIHLPVHGTLHAAVDGAMHDVSPGQALLVFPHRIHGSPAGGEAWSGLMLIFTPRLPAGYGNRLGNDAPRLPRSPACGR